MKELIEKIKNQEKKADQIVLKAETEANKKLEETKNNFQKDKQSLLKDIRSEEERFIKTAKIEAKKQTQEINNLYQAKISKLHKIDPNSKTELVIKTLLEN